MNTFLANMGVEFDESNNTLISKDKLAAIIKQAKALSIFFEYESLPMQSYILIDRNLKDLYPFPIEELAEWEKDGSCEPGDTLYEMKLLKKY